MISSDSHHREQAQSGAHSRQNSPLEFGQNVDRSARERFTVRASESPRLAQNAGDTRSRRPLNGTQSPRSPGFQQTSWTQSPSGNTATEDFSMRSSPRHQTQPGLAALLALTAALLASQAQANEAREVNRVLDVQVAKSPQGSHVMINGTQEPVFTVFRLDEPARVVIDLSNADVSKIAKKGKISGAGEVLGINATQFDDARARVGRLVVEIEEGSRYDVQATASGLQIDLGPASGKAIAAKAPAQNVSSNAVQAANSKAANSKAASSESNTKTANAKTQPAANSSASAKVPGHDDKVVRVDRDILDGVQGGSALVDVQVKKVGQVVEVELVANGPIAAYQLLELRSPARLALDLDGFKTFPSKLGKRSQSSVKDVRIGRHEGHLRVVVEVEGERMPTHDVVRTARGLKVVVGGVAAVASRSSAPKHEASPAAAPRMEESKSAQAAPAKSKAAPQGAIAAKGEAKSAKTVATTASASSISSSSAKADANSNSNPNLNPNTNSKIDSNTVAIRGVDLSGHGRSSRVVITAEKPMSTRVVEHSGGGWTLVLENATLPAELERRLDASALEGPIAQLAAYNQPSASGMPQVRIVASSKKSESSASARLSTTRVGPSHAVVWTFTGEGPRQLAMNTGKSASGVSGGFAGEAPAYAKSAAPRASEEGKYVGKRVDFTAKDLDIIQFLQAIGEVSKRNIVTADDVRGTVSLRLRNVPWDEALDIVLRTKGLGMQEIGNIIRIAPAEKLRAEREAAARDAKVKSELEPVKVRLIPVNYAEASEMAARVESVLTGRGNVNVDSRTNVLIVTDVVDSLAKAELLVRNLDTQTPQVLIEARIVEAQTTFTEQLGIQWGGSAGMSPATGNPTGLVFPGVVQIAGAATDTRTPREGVSAEPNFAVNMPAPVGANSGGGVGMIFGSAGGSAVLNLRLTANEVNGTIKTISAPKITTLDNQPATISQGISVPFSQVSAAGVNTAFVEARLSLDVTPHVTSDGAVLLNIKAQNNQPNPQLTGANGQPSISRREASTNVLVQDGDTTVIGGIYTRRNSLDKGAIPYLSKIPVLGGLFRKHSGTDDRTELLVFITPRILNRQESVVANNL